MWPNICVANLKRFWRWRIVSVICGNEFLMIGSKQQLQKLNPGHVSVRNVDIFPVQKACNLLVWCDSHLSMSIHMTKTCGAAFYWLYRSYNIKRINKFLSSKGNLISVIHAFVTSRLDYCNSILYGLPSSELIKLQSTKCCCKTGDLDPKILPFYADFIRTTLVTC